MNACDENIVTCWDVTYKTGFLDFMIALLQLIHARSLGLQTIQRYRYSTHFPVHHYKRIRILSLHESYPGNGFITVPM
jgi:hypothetical protein